MDTIDLGLIAFDQMATDAADVGIIEHDARGEVLVEKVDDFLDQRGHSDRIEAQIDEALADVDVRARHAQQSGGFLCEEERHLVFGIERFRPFAVGERIDEAPFARGLGRSTAVVLALCFLRPCHGGDFHARRCIAVVEIQPVAVLGERVRRHVDQLRQRLRVAATRQYHLAPMTIPGHVDAADPQQRDILQHAFAQVFEQLALADLRLDHVEHTYVVALLRAADEDRTVAVRRLVAGQMLGGTRQSFDQFLVAGSDDGEPMLHRYGRQLHGVGHILQRRCGSAGVEVQRFLQGIAHKGQRLLQGFARTCREDEQLAAALLRARDAVVGAVFLEHQVHVHAAVGE